MALGNAAAAEDQRRNIVARSEDERRAVICKALLEAARGPVGVGGSGTAVADGLSMLPQRPGRPGGSGVAVQPAAAPVLSHALLVTGSVTWCRTCGAYADARVRGLRGRCAGPPGRGGSGRTSIRRLLASCHPLSGECIGDKAMSLR